MIGAIAHHVAVGDGGEVAEEVLAALVGGDEAEPAGVPATRHAGLALASRGGRRPVSAPRGRAGSAAGPAAGRSASAAVAAVGGGTRAAAARGGVVAVVAGRVVIAGAVLGARHGGAAVGAKDLRGEFTHLATSRRGGGGAGTAGGSCLFSLFSLFCRPTDQCFFKSQTVETPTVRKLSDQRSAQNSNCFLLLGAHRWASRAARFGGRTPRCGSAASPRAR